MEKGVDILKKKLKEDYNIETLQDLVAYMELSSAKHRMVMSVVSKYIQMEKAVSYNEGMKDPDVKKEDPAVVISETVGNNVKSLNYNPDTDMWRVTYKNDLTPDVVGTKEIIEFLTNA